MYISFREQSREEQHISAHLFVRSYAYTNTSVEAPAFTNNSSDMHSNAFAISNHKMTDKRQHTSTCRKYTAHKHTLSQRHRDGERERAKKAPKIQIRIMKNLCTFTQ